MNASTDPLRIPLGTTLQIQATVPENAPRYVVKLVGALPGGSLVITAPAVDGKVQIVREGQRFNVRVLKGESVLGFVCQVLTASLKPYPHLHLEYPENVEKIVVRKGRRVHAEVDAKVRNTADPNEEASFQQATLVDLSESGARIASESSLGEEGDMLHLKFGLDVSGEREEIEVVADLRNVIERADTEDGNLTLFTGVQFHPLSRFHQVLLHAWVTNQALQSTLKAHGGG